MSNIFEIVISNVEMKCFMLPNYVISEPHTLQKAIWMVLFISSHTIGGARSWHIGPLKQIEQCFDSATETVFTLLWEINLRNGYLKLSLRIKLS